MFSLFDMKPHKGSNPGPADKSPASILKSLGKFPNCIKNWLLRIDRLKPGAILESLSVVHAGLALLSQLTSVDELDFSRRPAKNWC